MEAARDTAINYEVNLIAEKGGGWDEKEKHTANRNTTPGRPQK